MVGGPCLGSASPLTALALTDLDIDGASKDVSVFCIVFESCREFVVSSVIVGWSVEGTVKGALGVAVVVLEVSGCCVESEPLSEATLARETDEARASYGRL